MENQTKPWKRIMGFRTPEEARKARLALQRAAKKAGGTIEVSVRKAG